MVLVFCWVLCICLVFIMVMGSMSSLFCLLMLLFLVFFMYKLSFLCLGISWMMCWFLWYGCMGYDVGVFYVLLNLINN